MAEKLSPFLCQKAQLCGKFIGRSEGTENLGKVTHCVGNDNKSLEREYTRGKGESYDSVRFLEDKHGKRKGVDSMEIRQERKEDREAVFAVVEKAFANAPHTDHEEQFLVERLHESDAFIPELSLVAEREGKVVGYALFTKIKVDQWILLALAPLAVLPELQGKGIGAKLIQKGHEIAKKLDYLGCVVLGDERYYSRFSYHPASGFDIKPPFEVPDEKFMAVEFWEDSLASIYGTVEYAKEFFEESHPQ